MDKKQIRLTEYNQPLIEQRADPYVYRHTDGKYYFTASVPSYDRIVLRSAETLEGLKDAEEITVWTKHESGPQSIHIWAPEIHRIMGRWIIYYAAGDMDDIWEIRPYVLECQGDDPMKDPWKELGMMQAAPEDEFSFHDFSLDATVFENRGSWYYIWAEKTGVGKKISNLYIARMETPNRLETVQVLLTTPDYDWERIGFWVNEGPAVIKHDGRIFMTYSASETGACYCMGMLYTEEDADLLDPAQWTKLRYPVLKTDEEKGIYGPGHNSFVKSDDGVTDLCIYHARQYEKVEGDPLYDPNRHTMVMPVIWNEDGFPEFHYPVQKR
ncbi:MAG: family 43 glycosylhydrolase [Lachnospiraceae bacterium]|nr:family 43 glycosylhydrolase [Lachnospiraceae bacterium]